MLEFSFINGAISPVVDRVPVNVGDTVRLVVNSDATDSVHVHGVDVTLQLEPGTESMIEFVVPADPGPGLYDVETHDTELLVFQLEVR